jgi:hypothetical protein
MHPTPLRVEQDRADFDSWFGSTAFPIYWAARLSAKLLGGIKGHLTPHCLCDAP